MIPRLVTMMAVTLGRVLHVHGKAQALVPDLHAGASFLNAGRSLTAGKMKNGNAAVFARPTGYGGILSQLDYPGQIRAIETRAGGADIAVGGLGVGNHFFLSIFNPHLNHTDVYSSQDAITNAGFHFSWWGEHMVASSCCSPGITLWNTKTTLQLDLDAEQGRFTALRCDANECAYATTLGRSMLYGFFNFNLAGEVKPVGSDFSIALPGEMTAIGYTSDLYAVCFKASDILFSIGRRNSHTQMNMYKLNPFLGDCNSIDVRKKADGQIFVLVNAKNPATYSSLVIEAKPALQINRVSAAHSKFFAAPQQLVDCGEGDVCLLGNSEYGATTVTQLPQGACGDHFTIVKLNEVRSITPSRARNTLHASSTSGGMSRHVVSVQHGNHNAAEACVPYSPPPSPSSTSAAPTPAPSPSSTSAAPTPAPSPSSTSAAPTPAPSPSSVSPAPTPSATFPASPAPTPNATFPTSPAPTPNVTLTTRPTSTPNVTLPTSPAPTPVPSLVPNTTTHGEQPSITSKEIDTELGRTLLFTLLSVGLLCCMGFFAYQYYLARKKKEDEEYSQRLISESETGRHQYGSLDRMLSLSPEQLEAVRRAEARRHSAAPSQELAPLHEAAKSKAMSPAELARSIKKAKAVAQEARAEATKAARLAREAQEEAKTKEFLYQGVLLPIIYEIELAAGVDAVIPAIQWTLRAGFMRFSSVKGEQYINVKQVEVDLKKVRADLAACDQAGSQIAAAAAPASVDQHIKDMQSRHSELKAKLLELERLQEKINEREREVANNPKVKAASQEKEVALRAAEAATADWVRLSKMAEAAEEEVTCLEKQQQPRIVKRRKGARRAAAVAKSRSNTEEKFEYNQISPMLHGCAEKWGLAYAVSAITEEVVLTEKSRVDQAKREAAARRATAMTTSHQEPAVLELETISDDSGRRPQPSHTFRPR